MNASEAFLTSARKQFLYYKTIGEKAMAQLEAAQLFFASNEDTNSIAVIVHHLHGNMRSRWTDFLNSDGEKEWRNRDAEFEWPVPATAGEAAAQKDKLMSLWEAGWACLFEALDGLAPEQLTQIIYIRNEGHTVVEAINRQLAHYPYHVGQIVFYAKMLKRSEWSSLSIPKNRSKDYNADKFSREKTVRNFTDDELKKLQ